MKCVSSFSLPLKPILSKQEGRCAIIQKGKTTMKYADIGLELKKLRPTKNNLIVIKVLDEMNVDEAVEMSKFINEVLVAVNPEAKAVMVSNKVEVSELSEETMNKLGWVRKRDSDDILDDMF